MNIVIVGCGDIGIRCAKTLTDAGHRVIGVRRNISALPDWLEARQADATDPHSLAFLSSEPIDLVIYILAAASFNEHDYRTAYVTGVENTLAAIDLNPLPPKRFLFVSSTGVYHQNDGSVVDENSSTEPVRFNGQIVLQGEQLVRRLASGTCVRFSGIYGPQRLRMINRVAAGQGGGKNATAYTNRIHVEDCAGVLAHLALKVDSGHTLHDLYLASDSRPATTSEVEAFIAQALGLNTDQTDTARQSQRIAGSKQCNNQRLLDSGYKFIYPDYKTGYLQIINSIRN